MKILTVVILFSLFVTGLAVAQVQGPDPCDRACLEAVADQYIAAMVAHDPSKAPFAADVKFTENTIKLPLTEGRPASV